MTRNQELIEEAKKRGYTHYNFKCLSDLKQEGDPNLDEWYYEKSTDILFTNSCGNGGKAVYKEGVWAEIIKPMETFTPISMKCTQEQFDAIKPKLKGLKIENINLFSHCNYLVNNLGGFEKLISNVVPNSKENYNRKVHEYWDEDIFLKACGIEVETTKQTEPLNNKNMVDLMGYSVLVDNEEQGKKLQEIAIEQDFTWLDGEKRIQFLNEASFQFGYNGEKIISYNYGKKHYQDDFITKKAHFNDLFKEETLQEKEQRLLKELEEVRKEIEESKIKVGDWVYYNNGSTINKVLNIDSLSQYKYHTQFCLYKESEVKKITNPELIELLEQEMN